VGFCGSGVIVDQSIIGSLWSLLCIGFAFFVLSIPIYPKVNRRGKFGFVLRGIDHGPVRCQDFNTAFEDPLSNCGFAYLGSQGRGDS
jgi:hypothetical protein